MPNILGGTSQPVPTYRWKAIFFCVEKAPLEDILSKLDIPEDDEHEESDGQ